jgi:hypothetical protein
MPNNELNAQQALQKVAQCRLFCNRRVKGTQNKLQKMTTVRV